MTSRMAHAAERGAQLTRCILEDRPFWFWKRTRCAKLGSPDDAASGDKTHRGYAGWAEGSGNGQPYFPLTNFLFHLDSHLLKLLRVSGPEFPGSAAHAAKPCSTTRTTSRRFTVARSLTVHSALQQVWRRRRRTWRQRGRWSPPTAECGWRRRRWGGSFGSSEGVWR